MCHDAHVEVRGSFSNVSSLFVSCGSQELKSLGLVIGPSIHLGILSIPLILNCPAVSYQILLLLCLFLKVMSTTNSALQLQPLCKKHTWQTLRPGCDSLRNAWGMAWHVRTGQKPFLLALNYIMDGWGHQIHKVYMMKFCFTSDKTSSSIASSKFVK